MEPHRWSDYAEPLASRASGFDAHLAFEAEASAAHIYTIPVLPVLLQTPDYIRAAYAASEYWRTNEELDQLVELRLRRQEALKRREPKPLELIAVTHEASLRQLVGSSAIMRAQLEALIERSTEPNIDLRILPFSAPPSYIAGCMFALFEFGDSSDRDAVSIETHAGFRHIETTKQVAEYRQHYHDLRERSLDQETSRVLIRSISQTF